MSTLPRPSATNPDERLDVGLVQVHLAFADQGERTGLNTVLKEAFLTIAERRGGKLAAWDAGGGEFVFPVEGRESYDACCRAAIQMAEMMRTLHEESRAATAARLPVAVSIAGDAGSGPRTAGPLRRLGTPDRVTITERLFRHLSRALQARFERSSFEPEIESALYQTGELKLAPPGRAVAAPPPKPDSPARRALAGLSRRWLLAALAATVLLIANVFIVNALVTGRSTPTLPAANSPAAAPALDEIEFDGWSDWRRLAHDEFANPHNTELALAKVVRARPNAARNPPAAALRHDLAIAQVLLAYPRVRKALQQHLGIYDTFLGTGLSNPVSGLDYGSATLHEFFIPNLPDTDARVLTLKLKPIAPNLEKTVKALVEGAADLDPAREELRKLVVSHAESGVVDAATARFAILDVGKNQYKGTIGRPGAVRVFASSLAEVWNLKVKDAADRSGYRFGGGDTFFLWVFVPSHHDEAVLATWGHVLEQLPAWMEEAQNKRP